MQTIEKITGSDGKEMMFIPTGESIMSSEEFGPETPTRKMHLSAY